MTLRPRFSPRRPVCDGHEATRRIRSLIATDGYPYTPIVALSASCSDEEVRSSCHTRSPQTDRPFTLPASPGQRGRPAAARTPTRSSLDDVHARDESLSEHGD